jgi:hypothetical protein
MEICQKCGGNVGDTKPSDACGCQVPTLWKSRRERTAAGEALPDYGALVDEEWSSMYDDVIKDLCFSALAIPDDKLTLELVRRLIRRAVDEREHLADSMEDDEDFHRIWSAMLLRLELDLAGSQGAIRLYLPAVREDVAKQGGRDYAEGRTALARRERELLQASINVDAGWNPL